MAASVGVSSTMARIQASLTKPLPERCTELSQIMETTSTKELQVIFPLLLEHIFGFNNQVGWGLATIHKNTQYADFMAMKLFLAPEGPLMKLVYKLQSDMSCRYEFPISCLPYPTRRLMENGAIPVLYANKLQPGATMATTILSLPAFEYFLFQFVYFCVNPQQKDLTNWGVSPEALYPSLLEDYLEFFLPLNGKTITPMPTFSSPIRSPVAHHKSAMYRPGQKHSPPKASYHTPPPSPRSYTGLLRSAHSTPQRSVSHQNVTSPDYSEQETWRSETLVQIIVEFWLNQNSLDSENHGFRQRAMENVLPTGDLVRVVRMFVKHLHYFANSATPDIVVAAYQTPTLSPLDELKRFVFPQMVQKKLYAFLRHGFDHWPLDSSFRLLLETWLSFIQPWRYTDRQKQASDGKQKEDTNDKSVDPKWFQFIGDNMLFYSKLFHEFLARAFRIDLTSPKNAYMLFRVTKVFNLPNLAKMIEEAEQCLYEPMLKRSRHPSAHGHDGASYISHNASNMAAILSLQFAELEGTGFSYQPLFCEQTRKNVTHLLQLIQQAKTAAKDLQKSGDSGSNSGGGLLSWLGYGAIVDYNTMKFTQAGGYDDDRGKVETHLEHSEINLAAIFNISLSLDYVDSANKSVKWGTPSKGDLSTSLPPDYIDTPEGPVLTPLGRYQLMNGLRKFDIVYRGDPELQPIRSFECGTLVRVLYYISAYLNERFADEIRNINSRDDFCSQVMQQLLTVPKVSSSSSPSMLNRTISPLTPQELKARQTPRISLRFIASYETLAYLLILYLFMYMWFGTGLVGFALFLGFVVMCYCVITAFFKRRKQKNL